MTWSSYAWLVVCDWQSTPMSGSVMPWTGVLSGDKLLFEVLTQSVGRQKQRRALIGKCFPMIGFMIALAMHGRLMLLTSSTLTLARKHPHVKAAQHAARMQGPAIHSSRNPHTSHRLHLACTSPLSLDAWLRVRQAARVCKCKAASWCASSLFQRVSEDRGDCNLSPT